MGKTKKLLTQTIAIVLLVGILTIGVWGLYMGIGEIKKPVVLEKDSVDNSFEVDGQRFFVRHDGIYDANGVLHVGFVDDNTSKVEPKGPSLEEVLGKEDNSYDDYSLFGYGKKDIQKLYIQSVINSINSGRTIHVSRWVTSGDWSHDDKDITIEIP